MSSLKSQSPLKHHKGTQSFLPHFAQSWVPYLGKTDKVRGSGGPRFFPVICAQMVGLPQFPAPSAVSPGSPVLNPDPRGTFSWPTSKSPFTPFLPAMSLLHSSKLLRESSALLLRLDFLLSKQRGKGSPKTAWFPQNRSVPSMAAAPGANLPLHPHF